MAYDLYVVVKSPDLTTNLKIFSFGTDRVVGVQGFYATILKWTKCLFTAVGTDLHDPDYGTLLGGMVDSGVVMLPDLQDAVTDSVNQATATIKKYQNASHPPDDERLAAATVTKLAVNGNSVDLYVTLTNVSGTALTLTVPTGVTAPISG